MAETPHSPETAAPQPEPDPMVEAGAEAAALPVAEAGAGLDPAAGSDPGAEADAGAEALASPDPGPPADAALPAPGDPLPEPSPLPETTSPGASTWADIAAAPPSPPEPAAAPPQPPAAAFEPPQEPAPEPVAPLPADGPAPGVAATIAVPPLDGASEGEGGEWDLLVGKLRGLLADARLQERWNGLGGPLRGLGLLLAAVVLLRLYGAVLATLADLPLLPRLLQLVGLIVVLRFALTRLVRSSEREQMLSSWRQRWDDFRGRS